MQARGAGSCLPEVWASKLGCGRVPCASQGKRLHPGSCLVVSRCNTIAKPAQAGRWHKAGQQHKAGQRAVPVCLSGSARSFPTIK